MHHGWLKAICPGLLAALQTFWLLFQQYLVRLQLFCLSWLFSAKTTRQNNPALWNPRDLNLHGGGGLSLGKTPAVSFGLAAKHSHWFRERWIRFTATPFTLPTSSLTSLIYSLCSFTCSRWRMQHHLRVLPRSQRKRRRSRGPERQLAVRRPAMWRPRSGLGPSHGHRDQRGGPRPFQSHLRR